MPTQLKIRQGQCVSSVADQSHVPSKTIWNAPENTDLKQRRMDPNILMPGDELFIPELQTRKDAGATEQRHTFQVSNEKVALKLRIFDEGEPRANEPYVLQIDMELIEGHTDEEGQLEQAIPPQAERAVLRLGKDEMAEDYILKLGHCDPLSVITGIQARLKNLGYYGGLVDGAIGKHTKQALGEFQHDHDLKVTSQIDEATRNQLKSEHGC